MTEPVTATRYLEITVPPQWWLTLAEIVLIVLGVDALLHRDVKFAFITGGLGIATAVRDAMRRATVLFGADDVEVSGPDGGEMMYTTIASVEVRGRRICLVGNKRTLEFNVRWRDREKVLAEIAMRRRQLSAPV